MTAVMSRPLTVLPRLRYWGVMNFVGLGGAAGDDEEAAAAAGCGACATARTPRNRSTSMVIDAACASLLLELTAVMSDDQPPDSANAGHAGENFLRPL